MELDRALIALRLIMEMQETGRFNESVMSALIQLIKDAQQCVDHDYCVICRIAFFRQVSSTLQTHHVGGKVRGEPNFPDCLPVCGKCHKYLSNHQRSWLVNQADNAPRLSSYFFGWADVFDLIGRKSKASDFEELAEKFRSQGWYIRNNLRRKSEMMSNQREAD